MKTFAYLGFAVVPAIVLSSCSSPEESATADVVDCLDSLTELVHDVQDEDLTTAIDELHSFLEAETPGLVAALGDLDEAQKVTVINNVKQSPELAILIATIKGAQESPLVQATAMTSPEKVAQQMSLDTKMKIVDIAANIAKITVALGVVDSENVRKALDVPLPL